MAREEDAGAAAHAARRPNLIRRGRIVAALRAQMEAAGFVEVETPALQRSPGMEPHIQALGVELNEPLVAGRHRLYLHTSPEFAMKKLLAAGERRIFQICRTWRDAERSALHHPEFTLLEWYRAGEGAETGALIADCAALLAAAARAAGTDRLRRGERVCDPFATPERISAAEAFARHCGFDLLATTGDRATLAGQAKRLGLHVGESDAWEDIFHRILLERIEPHLGDGAPCILEDYPIALAANARPSPRDGRVAERIELYACGVELANGFVELTDAGAQRARFEADMALKRRLYGVSYPIDEEFLAALGRIPEAIGMALGVDRLVMLATGAARIEDVLWAEVAGGEVG